MTYWKRFIIDWNACRIIRSIAGVSFIVYGIQVREWAVTIFGMLWLAAGLFSMQCCAGGYCNASINNRTLLSEKETDFEEIK
jgi:hypothetical protein